MGSLGRSTQRAGRFQFAITLLMDHLSPRYIKQIIRLDPWHNPYRYAGTTDAYTLASDGADGKPGTADDVTLGRPAQPSTEH